jgi:tRNA (Thr-GGU) A37 N-methylase
MSVIVLNVCDLAAVKITPRSTSRPNQIATCAPRLLPCIKNRTKKIAVNAVSRIITFDIVGT